MTNLQIAFIFLIVFSLGFHWAAWRRFSECDVRCKALETHALYQAQQIAGLQTWCQNLDRVVDAKARPQPGLAPPGGPTRLQRAAEEAIRKARPTVDVLYPKSPNEV